MRQRFGMSSRVKIKGTGLAMVHAAVILILFGAVTSSNFTQTIETNIPIGAKGVKLDVGNNYAVKILNYSTRSLTEISYPGTPISEILAKSPSGRVKISGRVTNVNSLKSHTFVELTDDTDSMWVVFPGNITVPLNIGLTATGRIISNLGQPVLSVEDVDEFDIAGKYKVQSVALEVYNGDRKIGNGVAEYLEGKGGSGTFPLVDSSITGTDVYVVFQGFGEGVVPLTLKIIPGIDFVWIGIVLFAVGIILIMSVKSKGG